MQQLRALVLVVLGSCTHPAAPHATPTTERHFELDPKTWTTRPLRPSGYDREDVGITRERGYASSYTNVVAKISDGKLQLWRPAVTCDETAIGCWPGPPRIVTPERLLVQEQVPPGTAIDYVVRSGPGIVVGLGTEQWAYLVHGNVAIRGPRGPSPRLALVAELLTETVLQEPSGGLWRLRWASPNEAPSLERVAAVSERTLAFFPAGWHGYYVFTPDALLALDEQWRLRWRLPGTVWSALYQDVPPRMYALSIDGGSRVVLHIVDDETGKELEAHVVYEGPVRAAHLGHYDANLYFLHVTTR